MGARSATSLGILESLSFIVFFIFVGKHCIGDKHALLDFPGRVPALFLLSYMLLQIVPLPPQLVRIISPASYDMYSSTLGVVGPLGFIPLSMDVKATLGEFFRFTSYMVFYVLTIQILSDARLLKKTVVVISWLGGIIAAYALMEKFFSNGKIYWLFAIPENNTHIGPYVYKNHYAGFTEMLFPVVFAAFYYYRPRFSYSSFRESFVEVFTQPQANVHILLGFSALLMATSQFVSLSRGGIICFGLSMIFFILMMAFRQKVEKKGLAFLLFVFLIVLSVGWFGWEMIFQRFEDSFSQGITRLNGRSHFWKDSLGIIKDFPLTGTGFGSFGSVYPVYRTFPGDRLVDHAHNDYIELAATGGLVGFILVAWFVLSIIVTCCRQYGKRNDSFAIYMVVGSLSGIFAILLHSVSDFNFFSHANGLYFFFLSGLVVSASHTRSRSKKKTYLEPLGRSTTYVMTLSFAAVMVAAVWFNGGVLIGQHIFAGLNDEIINGQMQDHEIETLGKTARAAANADPFEIQYSLAAALAADYRGHDGEAEAYYRKALWLSPVQGEIAQSYGRFLVFRGDNDKGGRLLMAGLTHGRGDAERYKHSAAYLLHQMETDQGLDVLKKALELDSSRKNVNDCIAIMVDAGVDSGLFEKAMPLNIRPRYILADYFEKRGDSQLARHVETQALDYVEKEAKVEVWMFSRHYRRLSRDKNDEGAIEMIKKGLFYLPDSAELLIDAGRIYEKLGLRHKALEHYRKALVVSPDDPFVRKRMRDWDFM